MSSLLLKVRRSESPLFRGMRKIVRGVQSSRLPFPRFLNPLLRAGFYAQQEGIVALRWLFSYFVREPLFRGRCERVGTGFRMWRMPSVIGDVRISIGEKVNFFGQVDIFSAGLCDGARLILGNRVDLGHNVLFVVNQEIVLEDDVNVASNVRFMDTDVDPSAPLDDIAERFPRPEVKPVRIGRYAWIGHNAFIMKGVTVGEGAIVGVNSVVVNDIPPYCVAMGNPARVVVKNIKQTAAAPSLQE
jgi:acetyltransferase-like isoleucine patch superfamily enzyme